MNDKMNELEVKDLELNVPNVTVLSYDLDTTEIPNINDFIKQTLLNDGWQDEIENIIVRQLSYRDVALKDKLPSSTLWKEGVTPSQAINEFELALLAYNTKHEGPRAYGKAVAFCGNKYAAIDKRK